MLFYPALISLQIRQDLQGDVGNVSYVSIHISQLSCDHDPTTSLILQGQDCNLIFQETGHLFPCGGSR